MDEQIIRYVRLPDRRFDNQLYFALRPEEGGDSHYFNAKKARKSFVGMRVGQVYSIPVTNEGKTFVFGKKVWEGEHKNEEEVLAWQAEQRSADLLEERRKRETAESSSTSALERALRPVANAYRHLPAPQRLAFELWVLSVLRRG